MKILVSGIVLSIFQLPPLLLYFYNLLNPKGKPLKNMALRLMLVALIPTMYNLEIEIMLSFLFISILLLYLLHSFSVRYFRHLCFICLYHLIVFAIYSVAKYMGYPRFEEFLAYIFLIPTFIPFFLILYWLLGLLLFGKSYLSWHDGVCLLWYFGLILINPIDNPILSLVHASLFGIFELNAWFVLLFFVPPYVVYNLMILFYHLRYFIKLYRDKKFKQGSSKQ